MLRRRFTVVLIAASLAAAAVAAAAHAQEDHERAAQRALIEREQQSDAFALQLRQSQERVREGTITDPALEALHRDQRRRAEALDEEHLSTLGTAPDAAAAARFERERRARELRRGTERPPYAGRREPPGTWTPTLEPPRREWTPTLQDSPTRNPGG